MTADVAQLPVLAITVKPGDLDWQEYALCTQTDPDAFFPENGGVPRRAKAICRRCQVRVPCLRLALVGSESHGVWAGLGPEERETAARQHSRGVSLEAIIDAADESWDARMTSMNARARVLAEAQRAEGNEAA